MRKKESERDRDWGSDREIKKGLREKEKVIERDRVGE